MMRDTTIEGWCYPNDSSKRTAAQLTIHSHNQYELQVDQRIVRTGTLDDLQFSDRVGSIDRKIYFDSGALFETADNDSIDQLLSDTGHRDNRSAIANKLESSWMFAFASIALIVVAVAAFFKFGLPAAATYAAKNVSVEAAESLSDNTLALMDRIILKPSELESAETDAITNRFNERLASIQDKGEFAYQIHFRQMNGTANAFALPGGDIIITDSLARLTTDDELDSIIFHEVGHVVERHGLEGAVKATTISVLATVALGDLSTVAELTTGVAAFLLHSNYSRAAESEADDYALLQLEKQNMDPIHFASAMQKLVTQGGIESNDQSTEESNDYSSTHPSSASRIKKAQERSRIFNQQ